MMTTGTRTCWEIWDARECVSRNSTEIDARRGCYNDSGRTLTVFDPTGRIVAMYRDGRELVDATDGDVA